MNGASLPSSPAASAMVARTRANSPRESTVSEMLTASGRPNALSLAASTPATTLSTTVTSTAIVTGQATDNMSPGSMDRPKAKKNSAAKASLSGWTSCRMRGAALLELRMRPIMKAPMASAPLRTGCSTAR